MDFKLIQEELTRDEGNVPYAYQDSLGYWTIGIGHLIDRRKGGLLSQDQISYIFLGDISEKMDDLDRSISWWRNLDEVRQRVLVNMCFNMGIAELLTFKNTLNFIQSGDYTNAARNMEQSLWYNQVGDRAKRLVQMMETGSA